MFDIPMTDVYDRAQAAAAHVRSRTPLVPRVGVILGSGLGNFASSIADATTIPYTDIPHFPHSTVLGHAGQLILGTVAGTSIAVMQGRVHAYEGYSLAEVTFPTRVLALLGCRALVVTNAAGGIDPAFQPGSLVLITDHINLTGANAALGPNEPRFATRPGTAERFFDMSAAYSPHLRALALAEAARQGCPLAQGIYLAVLGPSFETPAEIRAFRTLGASLVGMSTVHEVIVARHMGLHVLGLSLVTNPAAGVTNASIDHNHVLATGQRAATRLTALLSALLPQIDRHIAFPDYPHPHLQPRLPLRPIRMPAQQLLLPHRPLILGVAGCSGSGKTLLARELVTQLNARLLPLDLYYRDLSHLAASERAQQNFDHPDSIEFDLLLHHLDELTRGHSIDRPIYDFSTHTRVLDSTTRVDPAPFLIIEGILALHHRALRQRFDLSVFVHTPNAVCLARRIHRDVRERGRSEQAVRQQFASTTRPMAEKFVLPSAAYASVTVEGTESLDWSVGAVLHALGRSLAASGTPPALCLQNPSAPDAADQISVL